MAGKGEALQIARELGVVRAGDLKARGISPKHLQRLYEEGVLLRSGRGVYIPADADLGEHATLVEAARRIPGGVICLLSALRLHGLTTQNPFEVWVALHARAWKPRVDYPPLRIIRMSGRAFTEGIEEHRVGRVIVPVYSPAKTVADCFKFRNKIGLDVALEALRDAWRTRKVTMDELWRYGQVCRVANVMRPYLEALV